MTFEQELQTLVNKYGIQEVIVSFNKSIKLFSQPGQMGQTEVRSDEEKLLKAYESGPIGGIVA